VERAGRRCHRAWLRFGGRLHECAPTDSYRQPRNLGPSPGAASTVAATAAGLLPSAGTADDLRKARSARICLKINSRKAS
jgi:hypothetical protein